MTQFGRKHGHSQTSSQNREGKGFTPKQERVYGRMFQAIEQIGHRLERTEEQRDVLIERLEHLESHAQRDSLTGKYYLPVKADNIDIAAASTPTPKWITATSIASVFIAVIALGLVMTKEPTLSKEQIAALQLNPPQFANLNPQSPYWEKLDLSQGDNSGQLAGNNKEATAPVRGRPDEGQLTSTTNQPDPLIASILESLEAPETEIETTDIPPAELASEDRYIELFEDESLYADTDIPMDVQGYETDTDLAQANESNVQVLPNLAPAAGEEQVSDQALQDTSDTEEHVTSDAKATQVAEASPKDDQVNISETQTPSTANEEKNPTIDQAKAPQEIPAETEERLEVAAVQTAPRPNPAQAKKADVQTRQKYSLKTAQIEGIPASLSADPALPEKARSLEDRAFEGIPEAQHDLATLYAAGASVPLDYTRAIYWFYQSAEGGIANAHYNLGVMSHQGLGMKQNLEQALVWYKNAAELGHPEALYNLGIAYIEGIGTPQDIERGANYFKRAAYSGVSQAAYNLGILYESSFMGGVDKDKAIEWYEYAAETGHQDAGKAFERLSGATFVSSGGYNETSPVSLAQGIEPAAGGSLTESDRSRIVEIQQHLIDRNLLPGDADGVYGPRTQDAIRSYQKTAGLPVTGRPSEDLLDHMRGAL